MLGLATITIQRTEELHMEAMKIYHEELRVTLHSQSDDTYHHFYVSPKLTVAELTQVALNTLAQGPNRQRVLEMLECYEPVLELFDEEREENILAAEQSLQQAGLSNNAVFRIAAQPRKEKIMFCRYSA